MIHIKIHGQSVVPIEISQKNRAEPAGIFKDIIIDRPRRIATKNSDAIRHETNHQY